MTHRAAVLPGINQPLEVREDVEIESPRAGEIKIRMGASGVCHSDLSIQNGTLYGGPAPLVCGHEGAGVVEDVGPDVADLRPGDHIVVSWVPQCGQCYFCRRGQPNLCEAGATATMAGSLLDGSTRLTSQGAPLHQMAATGTFSEYAIIPAMSAVKIDTDIDLKVAALIGCGVLTGVGAAMNTASIATGDTVAVIGCGGVGLNVIQGARIAGADRVIAVDMVDRKLELAKQFGATDTVNAGAVNAISAVMDLTEQRGADVTFEVIGLDPTIQQAITMARRGGQAILVGVPALDVMVTIPAMIGLIVQEKTVKGCWYGSSDVRRDVPRLVDLYRKGQLKLDELISREIKLDGINDAYDAMKSGEVARSVVVY
jgi:S-(hydroxymethyl)glutathione dehydrogenase/alcohol dehydrogenase